MSAKTYEWHVKYSRTTQVGSQITCTWGSATVYAENEAQAREYLAEELPEATVDSIAQGDELDD
jgi:hypothetical protein